MNWEKVGALAALVSAVCTGALVLVAIVGLIARSLPTTEAIRKAVKDVGGEIAEESVDRIEECAEEATQVLVNYRMNPAEARIKVYEDSLEQALDNGYVFKIPKGYITSHNWRDMRRLLTENERQRIESIVEGAKEEDQMRLMYLVLSENKMKRELVRDLKVGLHLVHLSPYVKVGIIGGYIGELKYEQ